MSDEAVEQSPQSIPQWQLSIVGDTPKDLWTEIATWLDPPDIVSLQKACRALNRSLYQKSVWITALRQMCRDHSLFFPSYPVDRMTLEHLQRAAMGPYRFKTLVERNATFAGHAEDAPDLNPAYDVRSSTEAAPMAKAGCSYLVPGGRFLFTFNCKELVLWDLGIVGSNQKVKAPLIRLAQVQFKAGAFLGMTKGVLAVSAVAEDKLRVAVAGGKGTVTVKAYDLGPFNSHTPSFRPLGKLSIDVSHINQAHTQQVLIEGHRVIIQPGGSGSPEFVIWEILLSKYAVIRVEDPHVTPMGWELNKIYIHEALIEFRSTNLRIWDIPPDFVVTFGRDLNPEIAISLAYRQQLLLAHSVMIHYPPLNDEGHPPFRRAMAAVTNPHQAALPLVFDVLWEYGEEVQGFMRYHLDFTRNPLREISAALTPTLKRTFPAGYAIVGNPNLTGLFAPADFSISLVKATMKEMGSGVDRMLRSVRDYVYTTKGPEAELNVCSRPQCRKRERALSTFKFCSACHLAMYCGSVCQKAHWKSHKPVCKKQEGYSSGVTAPPVRLVKLVSTSLVMLPSRIIVGMCPASGRMVMAVQNLGGEDERHIGVLVVCDYLS